MNERLKISLDDSLISVYSEAESSDANEQAEPKEQTASNEQVNLTKLRLVKAPKIVIANFRYSNWCKYIIVQYTVEKDETKSH